MKSGSRLASALRKGCGDVGKEDDVPNTAGYLHSRAWKHNHFLNLDINQPSHVKSYLGMLFVADPISTLTLWRSDEARLDVKMVDVSGVAVCSVLILARVGVIGKVFGDLLLVASNTDK